MVRRRLKKKDFIDVFCFLGCGDGVGKGLTPAISSSRS